MFDFLHLIKTKNKIFKPFFYLEAKKDNLELSISLMIN